MKTIPTLFLTAMTVLVLGSTAAYAGPSDSATIGLAAAKAQRALNPPVVVSPRKDGTCDSMVVVTNHSKMPPRFVDCNTPSVRNTEACKIACAKR